MAEASTVAVIMAGGSGTRFWPLSQPSFPKQYLSLISGRSLIQETVDRITPLVDLSHIAICSAESQRDLLTRQLPEISRLILEPQARNTAACLMLSLLELLRWGYGPETVMITLPADHFIRRRERFLDALREALRVARETHGLVTLGIVPTMPHTGYGYIEANTDGERRGLALPVARFIEKPTRERAEEFLQQHNFYWNAGIFVWTLGALRLAFERFCPEAWQTLSHLQTREQLAAAYSRLPSIPIDIAVLEKTSNLFVVPVEMGWSDIGSWDALYQLKSPSPGTNVTLSGDVAPIDSKGCLVSVEPSRRVALIGVDDLIVVESRDALLIARRDKDQLVKQASKRFDER